MQKGQTRPEYLWDRRADPAICPLQRYDSDVPVLGLGLQMRHVDVGGSFSSLNVSYGNGTNMSFHVHDHRTHARSTFYTTVEKLYGTSLVWLCFPVSPGERICGIWVLTLLGGLATVAVRTVQGYSKT
jgi:hypothetical protein